MSFLRNEGEGRVCFFRDGDPLEHVKRGAPDGINVYFDNTGGPQLEAALSWLRDYGPIACVVRSPDTHGGVRPRNLMIVIGKRLRIEGFIVSDHFGCPRFSGGGGPGLEIGKLINRETVVDGLDSAPAAFLDLLRPGARNIGKLIVKLSD